MCATLSGGSRVEARWKAVCAARWKTVVVVGGRWTGWPALDQAEHEDQSELAGEAGQPNRISNCRGLAKNRCFRSRV